MNGSRTSRWLALATLIVTCCAAAHQGESFWTTNFGGHLKYRLTGVSLPRDSLFRDDTGSRAVDRSGEARLNLAVHHRGLDFKVDYQFIAAYSGLTSPVGDSANSPFLGSGVAEDDRRWFDLSHTFKNDGRRSVAHRLDRLSVGLTTTRSAWRFGRQAISWGNGLIFTPMDVFNPFDPAAVDTEYKPGDDMLYGQFLFANGGDLQGVAVVRRDPGTGGVEADQSSMAFKYHGFFGANEFDLLAARHFDDRILGLGAAIGIGGSVWRGDLIWTDTDLDGYLSGVLSMSYSWTWAGRNVSGLVEYFRNGLGQKDGDYGPGALRDLPDLMNRLQRGELFTPGRNYLAGSLTIEWTPLLLLTPTLLVNLDDPSALAQLVAGYDWRQNLQVLAALNIPLGPSGTEYGGIESAEAGRYLSTRAGAFVQLAWYF